MASWRQPAGAMGPRICEWPLRRWGPRDRSGHLALIWVASPVRFPQRFCCDLIPTNATKNVMGVTDMLLSPYLFPTNTTKNIIGVTECGLPPHCFVATNLTTNHHRSRERFGPCHTSMDQNSSLNVVPIPPGRPQILQNIQVFRGCSKFSIL